MAKTNAVAVINNEQKNALAAYSGALFSDIDFEGLNAIIDRISESKEELTDRMREAATKFADDWDKLVVKRLEHKQDKLSDIESFLAKDKRDFYSINEMFEGGTRYSNERIADHEPVVPAMIEVFRSKKTWKRFADELESLADELEEMKYHHEREKPDPDDFFQGDKDELSFNDRVIAEKTYELAVVKHNRQVAHEEFEFRKKFIAFRNKMWADKGLAEFAKAVKAELRKSREAFSLVHEKSSLVKMAINFGGTDLLKALQELHEFQKAL